MPTRFDAYRMRDGVTPLAEDYFNPLLADIDARIAQIEDQRADLQRAIDDLTAFGLQRIDTLIGPAMQVLNNALADAITQRDALVADVGNLATQTQLTAAIQSEQTARQQAIADATAQPSAATYTYDAVGRVSSISETLPSGTRTTTYTYDSKGRVTQAVQTLNGVTRTTAYTYDANGVLTGFTVTES